VQARLCHLRAKIRNSSKTGNKANDVMDALHVIAEDDFSSGQLQKTHRVATVGFLNF
jgi:hypothetical protein